MKKLLVVSDWADDRLASQEVRTTVEGFVGTPASPNIQFISSTSSTINTAFLISQLVTTEEKYGRPLETVIFASTDPRVGIEQGAELLAGANFIVIHLASGIYLCGPNSGYDFSLIKNKIEEVYTYSGLTGAAQFRSRDQFARICAHLMDAKEDDLDLEEVSSNIIPELRGYYVGHIDNFGTLKTTIISEDLKETYKYDDEVLLKINGVEKKARYVNKKYEGQNGELIIFPGSSGHRDNPYMEIAVWQDFPDKEQLSASSIFNHVQSGTEIKMA